MDFSGRVVVITGGGKGLGRAIAAAFAEAGADMAIVGRDTAALDEAAAEIAALGRVCLPVTADLTREADASALAGRVAERFGRTDIIVTAAGLRDQAERPLAETEAGAFDHIVRANILSTVFPIRALLPGMIARREGRIVAISGVSGLRGRANRSAGVSAKWAIEGFVRSLAMEVGPANINVNAVCPWYVWGPRAAAGMERLAEKRGITAAEVKAEFENETALKRLSEPVDVARAVLFLSSDWARNITGQDLVVDGGWTL